MTSINIIFLYKILLIFLVYTKCFVIELDFYDGTETKDLVMCQNKVFSEKYSLEFNFHTQIFSCEKLQLKPGDSRPNQQCGASQISYYSGSYIFIMTSASYIIDILLDFNQPVHIKSANMLCVVTSIANGKLQDKIAFEEKMMEHTFNNLLPIFKKQDELSIALINIFIGNIKQIRTVITPEQYNKLVNILIDKKGIISGQEKNSIEFKLKKEKEILIASECPICLEPLDSTFIKTECNHKFHKKCLDQWLVDNPKNQKCPMCRTPLKLKVKKIGS